MCSYSFVRKPAGCPFHGWWLYDLRTASACIRPGCAIPEIIAANLANIGINRFGTNSGLLSAVDKKLFYLAGYAVEKTYGHRNNLCTRTENYVLAKKTSAAGNESDSLTAHGINSEPAEKR